MGSGVLGVEVICLEASKWLSHCVSQSIEARKQDPTRTYQNDNVIRQMYNVIHFDLFTIDSKREKIFCMIPKVSRALNGIEAYTKVGCTIARRSLPHIRTDKSRDLGDMLEKTSGITIPMICSSVGFLTAVSQTPRARKARPTSRRYLT